MNGFLNVLKPPGMTSHDVVSYLRKILKIKKVGHTGTLDPAAAGVLVIALGKATRLSDYILKSRKRYRAELRLGIETDTGDATGKVIQEKYFSKDIKPEIIKEKFAPLIGKQLQVPPMFSAVKINGKKMYHLAREGKEVERPGREIEIFALDFVDFLDGRIVFDVECSSGTYIRTLCNDIAETLDTVGHMSFLVRIQVGDFLLDKAVKLEEVADDKFSTDKLMPLDYPLHFEKIQLSSSASKKILNGVMINYKEVKELHLGQLLSLYEAENNFFALGKVHEKDRQHFIIKPEKVFV